MEDGIEDCLLRMNPSMALTYRASDAGSDRGKPPRTVRRRFRPAVDLHRRAAPLGEACSHHAQEGMDCHRL